MRTFINASAVAERTGFADATAFLRARDRLEAQHGFPLPMPTTRRPKLWRADQVDAWADAQGRSAAEMADLQALIASAPNVTLLAKARAA